MEDFSPIFYKCTYWNKPIIRSGRQPSVNVVLETIYKLEMADCAEYKISNVDRVHVFLSITLRDHTQ